MEIEEKDGAVWASMTRKRPAAFDVKTQPYPGFPTDMQAQMMALTSISGGVKVITETIFENRMMHAAELRRMGADLHAHRKYGDGERGKSAPGRKGNGHGPSRERISLDPGRSLRIRDHGGFRIYHISRGYEAIEKKLSALGVRIERRKDEDLAS